MERLPGIFEITLEERKGSPNVIQLYLVKGGERNLLIDAGYGNERCFADLCAALEEYNVPIGSLDVFLTHKHADHCGLARALQDAGAVLYMNGEEDRHLYDCLYYRMDHSYENAQRRVLARNGITPEMAPIIWEKFMEMNRTLADQNTIWKMTMEGFTYESVQPGQVFSYGDYNFRAVLLRGHTFGQMGLADEEHRLFFAADQVLNVTTPIVGTSHPNEHLLRLYLESLQDLSVRYADYTVIPAHEDPIRDLKATTDRIMAAYRKKIIQTDACVRDEPQTVWQIARQVYGLTPQNRSDSAFYNAKMITTKTFSMLEFLHDKGFVRRQEINGTLFWHS